MSLDTLVKPLSRLELFEGLRPLQLTEIVRRAERIMYKPGDVILREGMQGDAAIFLASGEAIRVSGPRAAAAAEQIPPGALVGEMAMLIETEHSSTVVARTSVRALRITRVELQAQMMEDRALAEHFVRRISSRLKKLADDIRQIEGSLARAANAPYATQGTSTSSAVNLAVFH